MFVAVCRNSDMTIKETKVIRTLVPEVKPVNRVKRNKLLLMTKYYESASVNINNFDDGND